MSGDKQPLNLLSLADLRRLRAAGTAVDAREARFQDIREWLVSRVMRVSHRLRRHNDICPLTGQPARLRALRIGICEAAGDDPASILVFLNELFAAFDSANADDNAKFLRAVVVGFPNCAGEAGLSALRQAHSGARMRAILRGRMIALFHADAGGPGSPDLFSKAPPPPIPLMLIRQIGGENPVSPAAPWRLPSGGWAKNRLFRLSRFLTLRGPGQDRRLSLGGTQQNWD